MNSILGAIGQAPVTRIYQQDPTTDTPLKLDFINPEVSFAYHLLQEVNVDVQNEGWVWNREEHYELLPNSVGKIRHP